MAEDYPDYTLPVVHIGAITVEGSVSVLGTVNVAGTVSISGPVTVTGTVSISGTVNISGSVTVTNTVTVTGSVSITGTVTVSGTVSISGTVTVSGTVSISGTVTVTGSVTVSGTVSISGTVTVSGTVSISGTVTVTGSVTVSGTVSISGTVTVTGSVTVSGSVNVSTVNADNIIIDKLTVGAYTEDRRTLSNNGALSAWANATGSVRRGKFFPRGCRGFLKTVDVYCKDDYTAGGTITVYISPHPSLGAVASSTITVPAGGAEAWRSASFNIMWNYDSLFIWLLSSTQYMLFGFSIGTPYDTYYSSDAGASWSVTDGQYMIRAAMAGETVGDVPVSGTVNTIQIPSMTATRQKLTLTLGAGVEGYDTPQAGAGEVLIIMFYATAASDKSSLIPRVKCDGAQVLPFDYTMAGWNDNFVSASTPGITIGKWDTTGNVYCLVVTVPYPFKRSLEVGFYNSDLINSHTGYIAYSYKKIS